MVLPDVDVARMKTMELVFREGMAVVQDPERIARLRKMGQEMGGFSLELWKWIYHEGWVVRGVSRWWELSRPTWLSEKIQDWLSCHWDGLGCLKRAKKDSGKGGFLSLFGRAVGLSQKLAACLVQIVF